MSVRRIGIVGAGVMGSDIAFDLAMHGYNVIMFDNESGAFKYSREKIKGTYRFVKLMKKVENILPLNNIFDNILFTSVLEDLHDVDLVIESISEDWYVKQDIYSKLNAICRSDAIFAVNTNCISISRIAEHVTNPGNVVGVHFMNPVPLKLLVETTKSQYTSQKTINNFCDFLRSLNKTPIVVNDYPGLATNRLTHLFMNEAAFLVQDGVATPSQIDMIFRQRYGHKLGPLETADQLGLDTVVNSLNVLYTEYQEEKFQCCPLLEKMVYEGDLGKKSGKGFYSY